MGFPETPGNMKFLATWQRWEGGHTANDAKFNWLNTTHGEGPKINSVGVRKFPSFKAGIRYTAETLMNGRYQDILDGLASGDPYGGNVDAGLQTWVSGRPDGNPGYAAKVLGNPLPPAKRQRTAAAVARVKPQVKAQPPRPPTPPGVDSDWDVAMRMIFEDEPDMMAAMMGMDDKTAQETGLVSKRGSLKPVVVAPDEGPKGAAQSLTKVAATQLGKPYVFGSGPGTDSFDCSDLIQWAYKQIGVSLPRVTYDQIKSGRSVKGQKLQPGDLVFPHKGHVVMYVGGGKVIAAPYTGTVVQYQPVPKNPLEVRRVL
jgi:cell wall-associated NlpC family hydrolase